MTNLVVAVVAVAAAAAAAVLVVWLVGTLLLTLDGMYVTVVRLLPLDY